MPTPPFHRDDAEEVVNAVNEALRAGYRPPGRTGSGPGAVATAATRLGQNRKTFISRIEAAKRSHGLEPDWSLWDAAAARRAEQGHAPAHGLTHELPPNLTLKGTSVLYDKEGNVEHYWNKSKVAGRDEEETVQLPDPKKIVKRSTLYDQQGLVAQQWIAEKPSDDAREKLWLEWAKELARDLPRIDPTPAPEHASSKLMACYPVGDHHLGMLSWHDETGENYDLAIGENLLTRAMDYLIGTAPPCEEAAVVFLGDFMHYDSFVPVTPTSRNQLDSDGRYPKMVRAAVRSMRYLIEAAAQRHARVRVVVEIGNHDLAASIFLMECLSNIYEREPRITVDTSPMHYHYFEWGSCLVGTHHGHGAKMAALPLIMATDQADLWGRTKFRYWWTGHIHHQQVQDFNGCSVESFRVLGPVDAWAHQKGYRSARDMKAIILHRDYGEVARHVVNPEMW